MVIGEKRMKMLILKNVTAERFSY